MRAAVVWGSEEGISDAAQGWWCLPLQAWARQAQEEAEEVTIEALVTNGRLYSCLSRDMKPSGWSPGLLMLETDTGIWWVTDNGQQWQPCYVSVAQHVALGALVGEMNTALVVTRERLTALEQFLGSPGR